MDNMINLIKLHYTSVFALKKSGAVMILLAIFITVTNNDGSMLPFGAALLLMLLNYSTLAYEDKSKMNYLVYSLPVEPKKYILSKYIYGVINIFISVLFADFIFIILKAFNMVTSETIPLEAVNLSIYIIGIVVVVIVSPIALVFGFNKARLILVFLFVLPVCFSKTIVKIIPQAPNSIINISLHSMQVSVLIIGILLTVISYIICSNLYSKRDID